jgi:hypothetical protein
VNYPAELLKAVDIAEMEGKFKVHLLNPDAIDFLRTGALSSMHRSMRELAGVRLTERQVPWESI